jgi:hypothetical protein
MRILENYETQKRTDLKENRFAAYVRNEPSRVIIDTAHIDTSKYEIHSSVGQGNWAEIPWIAVFDKDISTSAKKGYYIVYLFCSDMSGMYISLNQGWTYFRDQYGIKQGRREIAALSKYWKQILSSTLDDFSFDEIDLRIKKGSVLANGYELGHICGKFYSRDTLPSSDTLADDLRNLIGVFRELKGKSIYKQSSMDKFVNESISEYGSGQILEESDIPIKFNIKEDIKLNFQTKKIDYLTKAQAQKQVGYEGELLVMEYERQYLIKNNEKSLAKQVRHVSYEDGDGAGYDILSYNLDGTEKYIEVKTTFSGNESPFFVTANEVEFSKINAANYYLYRLYNYKKEVRKTKFFILHGALTNLLKLQPKEYIVKGIL